MYTVFLNETVGCVIESLSQNPSKQYPVGQAYHTLFQKRANLNSLSSFNEQEHQRENFSLVENQPS